MKRCIFILIILYKILIVESLEKEITVNINAGRQDCFFQFAQQGDVIDIDYQVIDGGHGDLDITFHFVDPTGRILIADYKKSENSHRADASTSGDYKFCFDNTFSAFNSKTVFFELIIEGSEESKWNLEENLDIQTDDIYYGKIEDIQEIINNVRNQLSKVRHLQDLIKSMEARDRNTAEENNFKVNLYSFLQLTVMSIVGFIQVVMLRSLFDDRSKVHNIWKNLETRN